MYSSSASQEIFRILQNPQGHYHVHTSPPFPFLKSDQSSPYPTILFL